MAKRAKQTKEERAIIDAERIAAAEKTGAYVKSAKWVPEEKEVEFVPDPILGVVELTPDNIGDVHNMIARAVGEPSAALVGTYEKELADEVGDEEGSDSDTEGAVEGDAEAEPKEPVSIVKDKFKQKYIENAVAVGANHKAAKRSNWDWLAQRIAEFCLDDKGKIDIRAFVALLNANEVDHSKCVNRNRGWEGRFRMTGRVALQKKVANSGFLQVPTDGEVPEPFEAPAEWRAKYQTKA